jgi:hypothetical protein
MWIRRTGLTIAETALIASGASVAAAAPRAQFVSVN